MTREEIIINEVQECIKAYKKRPMYRIDGVDCIVLDNDDINHISHKCAFWILSKEQDLLREFVEFVENRLIIWIKDENYQANIAEAENDHLRKNTSLLIAETIEAIKNSMKPTLEKFWRRENEYINNNVYSVRNMAIIRNNRNHCYWL